MKTEMRLLDHPDVVRLLPPDITQDPNAQLVEMTTTGNRMCQIISKGNVWGLKIHGRDRFISPQSEFINMQQAATLGIAAEPVPLASSEHLLYHWMIGQPAANHIASNSSSVHGIVKQLATLHSAEFRFHDTISPLEALQWNIKNATEETASLPALIERARDCLQQPVAAPLVNCHGDPVCQNILTRKNAPPVLIDWEYSHINYPYWDLAILANDLNLDQDAQQGLLNDYCRCCDMTLETESLNRFRGVLALISALWLFRAIRTGSNVDDLKTGLTLNLSHAEAFLPSK